MNDPAAAARWQTAGAFRFGDSDAMADLLLQLVIDGRKTATCWAAREGRAYEIGWRLAVCDRHGDERALIEVTELACRRFDAVDAGFARDEGEGDRSLEAWRTGHRRYFERNGGFATDMALWCCRFRLVDHRPPPATRS